jgi:hypothetical protein
LVYTVKKIIALLLMAAVLLSGSIGCEGEKDKDKKKADTTKKDDAAKPKP